MEIAAEHVSGQVNVGTFHQTLRDSGFRMVAVTQYAAPRKAKGPWSRHFISLGNTAQSPAGAAAAVVVPSPLPQKEKSLMLLAYLGEFVPVDATLGDFLPSNVVATFVVDRWVAAYENGLLLEHPDTNPIFSGVLQSLSAVNKIQLQDLPWTEHAPEKWIFMNLGRNYDENLLANWYNNVFKPNFPLDDEVESLESFKMGLTAEPNDDDAMILEIILAVRWEVRISVYFPFLKSWERGRRR
jgi:hypothetical protein